MSKISDYFYRNKSKNLIYRYSKSNDELFYDYKDSINELDNCIYENKLERGFLICMNLIEDRIRICFINYLRYVYENDLWSYYDLNDNKLWVKNLKIWDELIRDNRIEELIKNFSYIDISVVGKVRKLNKDGFLDNELSDELNKFFGWRNGIIHHFIFNMEMLNKDVLMMCKELFSKLQNTNYSIKKRLNK